MTKLNKIKHELGIEAVVKKYNEISSKKIIKEAVGEIFDHPGNYLDKAEALLIKGLNWILSNTLWKLVKGKIQERLDQLKFEDVSEFIDENLARVGIKVSDIQEVYEMIKDPQNPKYSLDSDIIKIIQFFNEDECDQLACTLSKHLHLDTDASDSVDEEVIVDQSRSVVANYMVESDEDLYQHKTKKKEKKSKKKEKKSEVDKIMDIVGAVAAGIESLFPIVEKIVNSSVEQLLKIVNFIDESNDDEEIEAAAAQAKAEAQIEIDKLENEHAAEIAKAEEEAAKLAAKIIEEQAKAEAARLAQAEAEESGLYNTVSGWFGLGDNDDTTRDFPGQQDDTSMDV